MTQANTQVTAVPPLLFSGGGTGTFWAAYLLVGLEEHADGAVGRLQAHALVVLLLRLQVVRPVLPQLGQRLRPGLRLPEPLLLLLLLLLFFLFLLLLILILILGGWLRELWEEESPKNDDGQKPKSSLRCFHNTVRVGKCCARCSFILA